MWDYIDTELPFNTADRSLHMKDMGSKGWELVSVSSNPVTACHVFFWKRSQSQDANKNDIPAYSETKKLKEQNSILNETKRQHEASASAILNYIR